MTNERISSEDFRAARNALGLSGAVLADRLGVRTDTLRRWESGREPVPYAVPGELLEIAYERRSEITELIARLEN